MPIDFNKYLCDDISGWSSLKRQILSETPMNAVIVDAGCKQGYWIRSLLEHVPDDVIESILTIGADPCEYKRVHEYDIYLNAALGKDDYPEVDFYLVGGEPGCNSLLKPSELLQDTFILEDENLKRDITHVKKTPMFRLDTVLNNFGADSVYYLKSDCQGSDLDVILGAGDLLQNTHYIEVEVAIDNNKKLYDNSPDIETIYQTICDLGFELCEFSVFDSSPLPEGELFFKRAK